LVLSSLHRFKRYKKASGIYFILTIFSISSILYESSEGSTIRTKTQSIISESEKMSRQQMPTRIEDIVCSKNVATTNYRCVSYWDSSTIFNTLESISLNQIELKEFKRNSISRFSEG
jgi:hypothetical protein